MNILIALAWPVHVHHVVAHAWFEKYGHRSWSTCPLTQLAFIPISSNPKIISTAVSPRAAVKALGEIVALAGHVFWAADLQAGNLASFTINALVGHRQVTDAYLIELAKHHNGKVATLDRGVAGTCCRNLSATDTSRTLARKDLVIKYVEFSTITSLQPLSIKEEGSRERW